MHHRLIRCCRPGPPKRRSTTSQALRSTRSSGKARTRLSNKASTARARNCQPPPIMAPLTMAIPQAPGLLPGPSGRACECHKCRRSLPTTLVPSLNGIPLGHRQMVSPLRYRIHKSDRTSQVCLRSLSSSSPINQCEDQDLRLRRELRQMLQSL